jgi:hypothetical protein
MLNTDYINGTLRREVQELENECVLIERLSIVLIIVLMAGVTLWWWL